MITFRYHAIFLLLMLLAAGCAGMQPQYATVEDNPYYLPPVGSELVLLQQLAISPREAAVFLQHGKVISPRELNRYHPNCKFEVSKLSDTTQNISPDTFIIQRVTQREFSQLPPGRLVKAAQLHAFGRGTPSPIDFTTIYDLRSAVQPNVLRLSCQIWLEPVDRRYLTLKEIRAALGEVMTIKLK